MPEFGQSLESVVATARFRVKCSVEHIMPSVCPTLEKANEARRRAWRELQVIRRMLALVVDELPPPPKPASFEAEGAILRAALARAIGKPWQLLENLESAIEALRPYLADPRQDGQFPRHLQDLNRAVNRDRPAPRKLEALRAAGGPSPELSRGVVPLRLAILPLSTFRRRA